MPTSPSSDHSPLTVLIDDVRAFRDQRPALLARSSQEALRLLDELGSTRIDDLWLDHDLGDDDTIRPVVELMVRMAEAGSPLNVRLTHVHSANVAGGRWIVVQLQAAGYPVVRSYSLSMWSRRSEAAAPCDLTGDQDAEADQRPTANNFAACKAHAMAYGTHVLATGSDLDFVNAMRAGAGLPPLMDDSPA